MTRIKIPYGTNHLSYEFNDEDSIDQILPSQSIITRKQEQEIITNALINCIGKAEHLKNIFFESIN